jgi:hypothetical protein
MLLKNNFSEQREYKPQFPRFFERSDSMEKGLLFFTLSMFCLWVILDEFFGTKRISAIAEKMTPNTPSLSENLQKAWKDDEQAQKSKEKVKGNIEKDKKLNSKEKKYYQGLVDHFYGPAPA